MYGVVDATRLDDSALGLTVRIAALLEHGLEGKTYCTVPKVGSAAGDDQHWVRRSTGDLDDSLS